MKLGQLIIFFFKNHAENEAGRLVLNKALNEVKANGLQLSLNIF